MASLWQRIFGTTPTPSTIQLDTSQLDTINATINDLRQSVTYLRESNAQLKKELEDTQAKLQVVERYAGVDFPKFGLLPPEVRRMIWKCALREPQIHIFGPSNASASSINAIFQACSEARSAALSLKLHSYRFQPEYDFAKNGNYFLSPKNYVNLDVDTIWVNRKQENWLDAGDIQWVCGQCGGGTSRKPFCVAGDGCVMGKYQRIPKRVKRLAFNLCDWEYPTEFESLGSFALVQRTQVEELVIVVGDPDFLRTARNIQFIHPEMSPSNHDKQYSFGRNILDSLGWDMSSFTLGESMEKMKHRRYIERESVVEEGAMTWEQLDKEDVDAGLGDLEEWEIPDVTFVQGIPSEPGWLVRRQDSHLTSSSFKMSWQYRNSRNYYSKYMEDWIG